MAMALKIQSSTSTCKSPSTLLLRSSSLISSLSNGNRNIALGVRLHNEEKRSRLAVQSSSSGGSSGSGSLGGEKWGPKPNTFPGSVPCLSDILWPSAGAFAAMAALGRMDQVLASRGLSITIAPLGAVCAVLFAAPNSPAAKKYNIFVAQIGCAAFGVLALSMFGPGWLARAASLAASIAFMVATGSLHPPAASLPILFIDGAKFHSLNLWYTLFPGAAGCLVLCLIQEIVTYLKQNCKF